MRVRSDFAWENEAVQPEAALYLTITVKSFQRHLVGEVMWMCSVGGPMDVDYKERVKGKDYKCRSCGEKFKGVGKHPICPSCQSDDVAAE
jgi:rubrerythrin